MKNFFKFSEEESIHLLRAWAALTLAFTIVLGGGGFKSLAGPGFLERLIVAGLVVGSAFVFHELGHKFVAQKYGFWAEFRSFDWGLVLAVGLSFLGFIFAAPGAVMISGVVSTRENGHISAVGPLINIVFAILFGTIGAFFITEAGSLSATIVQYGIGINGWLALFNLIPFGPLDGAKVFNWSVPAWGAMALVAAFLTFGLGFF